MKLQDDKRDSFVFLELRKQSTKTEVQESLDDVALVETLDSTDLTIGETISSKYAHPQDVVQIKGALAALGYYQPDEKMGMTPYFDTNLGEAIRLYQRDAGLPITGMMTPDGLEISALNKSHSNMESMARESYIKMGGYHNYMSGAERTSAIISGEKVRFQINDNPNAIKTAPHEIAELGVYNVKANEKMVDVFSKKYNVDSNLVKSIMYMEGANGHWSGLNYLADMSGLSKSVMPMNIQNQWGKGLIGTSYNPHNKEQNIEAGVKLIKRLSESIENPTPEKIGTLWNGMMKDEVSDVGARVGRYYKEKPWGFPYKKWTPIETISEVGIFSGQSSKRKIGNLLERVK